jgi:hypothetical protein
VCARDDLESEPAVERDGGIASRHGEMKLLHADGVEAVDALLDKLLADPVPLPVRIGDGESSSTVPRNASHMRRPSAVSSDWLSSLTWMDKGEAVVGGSGVVQVLRMCSASLATRSAATYSSCWSGAE